MDQQEFERQARERGFASRTVEYPPDNDPPLHAHDFSAVVLVTSGTLLMGFDDRVVTLEPGQTCEVPAGTLHAERTGPGGATALLATG